VEIACRFFCFPGDDLGAATRMLVAYATVPVYEAFFRAHGWGERIDPMVSAWNAGDRRLALELAPEELVREICIFGTPEQQRERLEEFVARGVQTPILTPVCPPEQVMSLLEAWAP
jgi:alkanesulfonate monooxygenase SsuD/methylene tetrahydromethanopterin reductase-like flavin-dependent oxidoreductase (luciferase family)